MPWLTKRRPEAGYATGLSCGAFGTGNTWRSTRDEQVAAAVPSAGEGRPAWATAGCDLGKVAIWAFHGELDDVVDPQGSIQTMTTSRLRGIPADRAR